MTKKNYSSLLIAFLFFCFSFWFVHQTRSYHQNQGFLTLKCEINDTRKHLESPVSIDYWLMIDMEKGEVSVINYLPIDTDGNYFTDFSKEPWIIAFRSDGYTATNRFFKQTPSVVMTNNGIEETGFFGPSEFLGRRINSLNLDIDRKNFDAQIYRQTSNGLFNTWLMNQSEGRVTPSKCVKSSVEEFKNVAETFNIDGVQF